MSHLWCFLLVFVFLNNTTYASDVTISLKRLDNNNTLESQALHVDLFGYGVSLSKSRGTDALDVGLYAKEENGEGRGMFFNILLIIMRWSIERDLYLIVVHKGEQIYKHSEKKISFIG